MDKKSGIKFNHNLNPKRYLSFYDNFTRGRIKRGEGEVVKLPFRSFVIAALFINVLAIASVFFFKDRLPPELPLFYGLPQGEEQLAPTLYLVIPSATTIIVLVINSVIAYFTNNEFLSKTLVISSFVMCFFSLITTFKIFLLVGSF